MMKTISYLSLLTFLFLYGCSEKESGPDITSLEITVTKSKILGDNKDYTEVSVTDQNGNDVMQYVTVYAGGLVITDGMIRSAAPSALTVYAEYKAIKSNELQIEVMEDVNLKFRKNVLMEQYTGTWCGWCPRAINQINILENTDQDIVHSALHLSDAYSYSANSSLFQSFGFTGIPTVHADRTSVWSGDPSAISLLHSPSRIGISAEVSGSATVVNASVKVKFGYQFPDGLELSVYLLHDSLVADQTNYYNTDATSPYYQKGSPMVGFMHRNILLKAGTNMFGDEIPQESIDIGNIYTRTITFTNFRCDDIRRIVVIALVSYQDGRQAGKVANCLKARVGEKKDFIYVTG